MKASFDKPAASDTAELWGRFKESGDMAARQVLIERHMGFARFVAARCYTLRARDGVGFNDYLQFAALGLIEAVDRFRPDNGQATFETYAAHRIRGAVLNGLVEMSEVNAQVEAMRRTRRERLSSLAGERGGDTLPDRLARMADMATGFALGLMLDDLRIYQHEEGRVDDNCYADTEMRRLRATLARLVEALPQREQSLIREHYFHERPFESIARAQGLTKGRISQLHKRALGLLQSGLKAVQGSDWSF